MYRNSLVLEKIKCEDLYLQYENLIKDNICGIQKQSFNLRDYLLCQKKKIVEITRKQNDKDEPIELKTLLKLYDNVQKELISIEEDCNKFWVKMKLDLLLENKCRSELFLENDLFKSDEDNFVERCHCTWKNVFKSIRNDGRIRSDKLDFISTKFDNTDLKFKQDLMDLRTKVFHLVNDETKTSKWYLVVSPQIEKILKKRRIYSLHLNPSRVFNLLLSIPESGIHFKLSKIDLIFLLENIDKEGLWLMSWKPQLKTFDKDEIAAILIQSRWRGYWVIITRINGKK
ncbi:hypothetical protein M0802_002197 [Mischocyttarus mexicanus]|nr:hypothetical protein M0802_002197 [Mischocyttarus mexicanus]